MDNTVLVTTEIRFRKWIAPNFARQAYPPGQRQDGFSEGPATSIADLPKSALDDLAQAFIDDLYAKSGHPAPRLVSSP